MTVANQTRAAKTVADPNAEYESLLPAWRKSRAICGGEAHTKAYDGVLDVASFTNVLIPFSPSMTDLQYRFYKAEAELPGITAEFAKMLVGGLLRKEPTIKLPESLDEEVLDWIRNSFGEDDSSLLNFLDTAIWEELQARAWVYVDYPVVDNAEALTPEEAKELKPYPILWKAEEVINWTTGKNKVGKIALTRVITRGMTESFKDGEFHPTLTDTVKVYELDANGYFQIRTFKEQSETNSAQVVQGQRQSKTKDKKAFVEDGPPVTNILVSGKRLEMIPAWPLNGQITPGPPMLTSIIDKEVSLYNKCSRRNHLLYGAATYTPIISSDMTDEMFDEVVGKGLGTWLKLRQGDTATVLETPTAALQDMDRAIGANIEEMAKLGIRMLSPETEQSGVALELRNAAQTARLAVLSNRISRVMEQVIAFMILWRYGIVVSIQEIEFTLSEDFNPTPLGADWLRLATEWYQQGLIPRSVWLQMLKLNDMIPPGYDDEKGREEIEKDLAEQMKTQQNNFAEQAALEAEIAANTPEPKQKEVK